MKIYNDEELNQKANFIRNKVEELSENMSKTMRSNSPYESSFAQQAVEKIYQDPLSFGLSFYRQNINSLRFIRSKVGAFDESYVELSDGVALSIMGVLKMSVMFANLLTSAGDFSTNKESQATMKAKQDLSGISALLVELTQMDISLNTRIQIKNLQQEISAVEKKINPKSGCYIATFVYGDYYSPEVVLLRNFRDRTLEKYVVGRWLVHIYYFFSPKLILYINDNIYIKSIIKAMIDRLLFYIQTKDNGK